MSGDINLHDATVHIDIATLNVYGNAEVLQRLDALAAQLALQGATQLATLDELVQAANDESSVDDSIVSLVQALKASVDAALGGVLTPEQQAKVDAAFDTVNANKQKIADAVLANTPAAPPA